jgi:hypothetical protein
VALLRGSWKKENTNQTSHAKRFGHSAAKAGSLYFTRPIPLLSAPSTHIFLRGPSLCPCPAPNLSPSPQRGRVHAHLAPVYYVLSRPIH